MPATMSNRIIPEPRTIPDAAPGLVPLGVLSRAGQQTWVMRRARGAGAVLVYDVGAERRRARRRSRRLQAVLGMRAV